MRTAHDSAERPHARDACDARAWPSHQSATTKLKVSQNTGTRIGDCTRLSALGGTQLSLVLAEVHVELQRLHDLEADLNRLLERQPDPTCPDMTAGAAAWWCAPDCPDPCQSSEGR